MTAPIMQQQVRPRVLRLLKLLAWLDCQPERLAPGILVEICTQRGRSWNGLPTVTPGFAEQLVAQQKAIFCEVFL